MARPKPWDHVFVRDGSPYLWCRFTVHEHGRPIKVRRSTDVPAVFAEKGKKVGGTKRLLDPEAHAQAVARAAAIFDDETKRPTRDPSPQQPERIRRTVLDAYREWAGTEEEPGKLLELAKQRDEQFLRRQTFNMRYVVPQDPAEVAAKIAKTQNARLLRALKWKPPWTFVDEITKDRWEQVRSDLHHTSKAGFLKAASIRSLAWTLRAFLAFCRDRKFIDAVPQIDPPAPTQVKKDQAEYRSFTEEERDAFLGALDGKHPAAYGHYCLMMLQGLRKSSVERMRRKWIDFPTGVLTIPAAEYKDRKRDVSIALHGPCVDAIKAALADREDISGDALVFGPFDHTDLFWRIVRDLEFKDIERLTAHHIGRRTSATILAEHGATESELLAAHGWSTPEIAHQYIKGKLKLSQLANSKMPLPKRAL